MGLPLAALALVAIAADVLPDVECGESTDDEGWEGIFFFAVTLGAIGACSAAAAVRVRSLGRVAPELFAAVGSLAIAALAFMVVFGDGLIGLLYGFFLAGTVATGIASLVLIGLALTGRTARDAGALLPCYLVGAAFFAIPSTAVVGLLVHSGIGC